MFFLKYINYISFFYVFIVFVSLALLFKKERKNPLAAFIPFWHFFILAEILKKPFYWVLIWSAPTALWFLSKVLRTPIEESHVGLVIFLISSVFLFLGMRDLSKRYQKGKFFAFGLLFLSPIFFPILAFSKRPVRKKKTKPKTIQRQSL